MLATSKTDLLKELKRRVEENFRTYKLRTFEEVNRKS